MFIIGKILAYLLLPPGLFFLLAVAVFYFAFRKKNGVAYLLTALLSLLIYFFSTPVCSNFLIKPLEDKYPPLLARTNASAVVVLGGGYNEVSPEYGKLGALTPTAEKRAVYGLELARSYNAPLIFTGGKGFDATVAGSEAEAARRLWLSLGYDPKLIEIETESLDTRGNASGVAKLAKGRSVILVTSAMHMPRSVFAFQKAGIAVIPAPTDYRAKRSPISWTDFLPDASELDAVRFALHEYIGIAYYRLTM